MSAGASLARKAALLGLLGLLVVPTTATAVLHGCQPWEDFQSRAGLEAATGTSVGNPQLCENRLVWRWQSSDSAPFFLGFQAASDGALHRVPVDHSHDQPEADVPFDWFNEQFPNQGLGEGASLRVYFDDVRAGEGPIPGTGIVVGLGGLEIILATVGMIVAAAVVGVWWLRRRGAASPTGPSQDFPAAQQSPSGPTGQRATERTRYQVRLSPSPDLDDVTNLPAPRYKGQPLRKGGRGYLLSVGAEGVDQASFSIPRKGLTVQGLRIQDRNVTLVVGRTEQAVRVEVLSRDSRSPVARAPVIVEGPDRRYGPQPTDGNGRTHIAVPPGAYRVTVDQVGAVESAVSQVEVPEGEDVSCQIESWVGSLPLPDPAEVTIDSPASLEAVPALAQLGNEALRELVETWRRQLADPETHFHLGDDIKTYPSQLSSGIDQLRQTFADLLREKKVQSHLSSIDPVAWDGTFEWRLDSKSMSADATRRFHQEIDQELTDRTGELVIRPGLRLLDLAEDLVDAGERQDAPPAISIAHLTLSIVEAYLHDPILQEEWRRR